MKHYDDSNSTITSMDKLVNAFTYLPGVGKKTAERYAYSVIAMEQDKVEFFSQSLVDAKNKVKYCTICGNFTEHDVCSICKSRENSNVICVVKEPKDVVAIEKSKNYKGLYHVLHGTISPLEGRGPNDIRIKELVLRINNANYDEVIMATNPDVEGEVTASYIAKLLKPLGIKVSRIAQGVQMGSDLQYADEVTLTKAINARIEM